MTTTAPSSTSTASPSSPADLASWLGQHPPTPEQSDVIGAGMGPGVVVAGAGSGKTETMAARVVWLVATGQVAADGVLGLTFTRKAAAELGARVRSRLRRLPQEAGLTATQVLADLGPSVMTYDAFAARLVNDHAGLVGMEPRRALLTPTGAWQIANQVVEQYDGDMSSVDLAPGTVVEKVLALHAELAGHLVEPAAVAAHAADLGARIESLPDARGGRSIYAPVRQVLQRQQLRVALLPLVEAFRHAKREAEAVDFADLTALAVQILEAAPALAESLREQHSVVLLDEYQDTSHAQLRLLRLAFGGGHPVLAVGDPCQSIYAWRGATASSMAHFPHQFCAPAGPPAPSRTLSTSFRSSRRVLDVANVLSEGLRSSGWLVPELHSRPGAPEGAVEVAWHTDADAEAAAVADRAARAWDDGMRRIAVLVRARRQIARLETALRALGLPVDVVGVGGLLATPEVVDVVSALRAAAHASCGPAVIRLLTGPRLRLGPHDLRMLHRFGHTLAARDPVTGRPIDEVSLADALQALPATGWLSAAGHDRARRLARDLADIRAGLTLPLTDQVRLTERVLGLDVETLARPDPVGRANIDRLEEVVADFAAQRPAADTLDLLSFLDAAQTQEQGLRPGEVEVQADCVQVLTVHGAKGLEWEAVFVPGLVNGQFPAGGGTDKAWLGDPGTLPFALRGDARDMTQLDLASAADQRGVRDAVEAFTKEAGAVAEIEERRLAYVAVTRAENLLVCSGYRWGDGVRPLEPSPYLHQIRESGATTAREWAPDIGRPDGMQPPDLPWPSDPLGERRPRVAAAATLVRRHIDAAAARSPGEQWHVPGGERGREWAQEADLLLAERARRREAVHVTLPQGLTVSDLVVLRRDPDELAARLRRPMPGRSRVARRGTAFHAWVEQHYGQPALLDLDDLPGAADDATPTAGIGDLTTAFLRSAYADRRPRGLEVGFDLALGRHVVRGRVDAVFTGPHGIEVVDWKTGRQPSDSADRDVVAVQLAAYRLAMAHVYSEPLSRVSAAFHYVAENLTVAPSDLLDEAGLIRLVDSLPEAAAQPDVQLRA